MGVTSYRWDTTTKQFVCKKTGEPMPVKNPNAICRPYVRGDLPAYRSPVTGEVIDGRRARREDLKKHNCVEVDPPSKPRPRINKAFCERNGVAWDAEAASTFKAPKRIDPLSTI